MARAVGPREIVIVVFDGMKLLDAAGPAEVFAEANRFGADYRLRIASVDGADVTSSIGTTFAVTDRIAEICGADTVLVSGGDDLVGRPIDPGLVASLRDLPARTRRLASICTGSFILAEAGLLDGRRATTHWRHARLLARAYPTISVEPDAIFVRDGDVYTSAGVSAGIDLALALVEADCGADLVRNVARSLVVYLKRAGGQSQFSTLVESDAPARVGAAAGHRRDRSRPDRADHSVKSLAALASLSTRQLTRLFQAELGTTPARYVETVRIDVARAALDAGRPVGDSRPPGRVRQRRDPETGVRQSPRGVTEGVPGPVPQHVQRLSPCGSDPARQLLADERGDLVGHVGMSGVGRVDAVGADQLRAIEEPALRRSDRRTSHPPAEPGPAGCRERPADSAEHPDSPTAARSPASERRARFAGPWSGRRGSSG